VKFVIGDNADFIDRFVALERRVRTLELRQRAYLETTIVAGEFDDSTVIPPFFTPFGGAVVAVYHQTLNGSIEIRSWRGADVSPFVTFTADTSPTLVDLDEPKELNEGDTVSTVPWSVVSGTPEGLSVGYVIEL